MAVTLDADAVMANGLGDWLAERRGDRVAIRRKYRSLIALSVIGGLALFAFCIYAALRPERFGVEQVSPWLVLGGVFVSITGAIVGAVLSYQIKVDTVSAMKRETNGAIAKALGIRYSPTGKPGQSFDLAHAFQVLPRFRDRVCSDFWEGERGDVVLRLFEVALSIGSGRSRTIPFVGILIHVYAPSAFPGATVVRRPSPWRRWNPAPIIAGEWKLDPVPLDDASFAKRFMAYGNDSAATKALLTPEYLETLARLERTFVTGWHRFLYGSSLNLLFIEGHLVIAISARNLFESAGFSASEDRGLLEQTLDQLRSIFDLAEQIDVRGTRLTND